MKAVTKILLYYSIILSSIIIIVGVVTSRNNEAILIHLFYLPVLLYLLYVAFNKRDSEISIKTDGSLIAIIVLFVGLFVYGVYTVHISQHVNPEIQRNQISTPIIIQKDENIR